MTDRQTPEWDEATLADVVDPGRPITYGIVQPGPRQEEGVGIPIIRGQDYGNGVVRSHSLYWVSPEIAASYKRSVVRRGDLLISIVGVYVGTIGEVPAALDGANLTQTTARLAIRADLDSRFFFHQLISPAFQREVSRFTKGSAQPGLNLSDVEWMRVVIPPLHEQRRIAAILDTIDETIQATEGLVTKLTVTAMGLATIAVAAAVAGGGIGSIGQIADGAAGSLVQTGPFGSQLHASDYVGEGVPTFMPTDISGGRLDLLGAAKITESKANELSRHRLRTGDVLFGRRGDLSRCAVVPSDASGGLCGTGCLLVRIPQNVLAADWLALVYRHDFVQRQVLGRAVGTTMLNLSGGLIRSLLIPLPTEQSELLMTAFRSNEQRREIESENLSKLRELRAGLAADLLSGRVRTVAA